MSTYNGEKYIREQIDSILDQSGVDVRLIIRDDGSKDNTIRICREYADRFPNVSFEQGKNLGVGASFLKLLREAPDTDYFAFADQDDFWLEDKLRNAVEIIQRAERKVIPEEYRRGRPVEAEVIDTWNDAADEEAVPVLYGSNQSLVDKNLGNRQIRFDSLPPCGFYESLTRNIIYGCTMVMNRALRDACRATRNPCQKVLRRKNHDGWVLYIAYLTGIFVFDQESRILYRQHEAQVVGARELSFRQLMKSKAEKLLNQKNKGVRSTLAKELIEILGDEMDSDIKRHLEALSRADTWRGAIHLLKDEDLVKSFHESKPMILARGLIKWI